MTTTQPKPSFAVITLVLPGPDRKRTHSLYHYRITYRNPATTETGCQMTWEVGGGREPYQVALERTPEGRHRWHCSCADAVYRGEARSGHACKHVRGLLELLPPAAAVPPRAA